MVSRSKSTTSRRSDPMKPNPHRFYATSCNSSGDLAAQRREDTAKDEYIDDRPDSRGLSRADLIARSDIAGRGNATSFLAGEAQEFMLPEAEDQSISALDLPPVHTWVNVRERAADKLHKHKQNPMRPATERVLPRWRRSLLLRANVTLLEVPDGLRTPPLSSGGSAKESLVGPLTPRTFVSKSLAGSLRSFRS
ncbi:hypothetical protein DV737_g3464, partial [Chaetothyriales sp. CBS 132003]